jgi:hypothetical protein
MSAQASYAAVTANVQCEWGDDVIRARELLRSGFCAGEIADWRQVGAGHVQKKVARLSIRPWRQSETGAGFDSTGYKCRADLSRPPSTSIR